MNLQLVSSVFKGVALRIYLSRKLARLACRDETGTKAIGNRCADEETTRLGSNDLGNPLAKEVIGDCINTGRKPLCVRDERGYVLEDDPGLRIVRNVDDEILVREACLVIFAHDVSLCKFVNNTAGHNARQPANRQSTLCA